MSQVFIVTRGETIALSFVKHQYRNLMELIVNELYEEIGDCRGKALCGTCHVYEINGGNFTDFERHEQMTLDKLTSKKNNSHLSCQILVTDEINGRTFELVNDE